MSTQKRNNKYDGMDNKEQIIARILEDVKSLTKERRNEK